MRRISHAAYGTSRILYASALVVIAGAMALVGTVGPADAQSTTSQSIVAKIRELNAAGAEIRQIAFTPAGAALILHGTNDWTWIPGPLSAARDRDEELLDELLELEFFDIQVWSVAFSPNGWVVLHDPNEVAWSGIPQDTADKIRELYAANKQIKQVAFTAADGWVILYDGNGASWNRVPQTLTDKLTELNRNQIVFRQISFTTTGGWVLLHGANDATWLGIPQSAADKIRELYRAGTQMKQVAFTAAGGWIILHGINGASWSGLP